MNSSAQAVWDEYGDDLIQWLREYYKPEISELHSRYPNEQKSLRVDWMDLYRFDPDLAEDVVNQHDRIIEPFNYALRDVTVPSGHEIEKARVRFHNVGNVYSVGEYRHDNVGELMRLRGQVKKTSEVKPRLDQIQWVCECGNAAVRVQPKVALSKPGQCEGCGKRKAWSQNYHADQTIAVNHQLVRLKQPPEDTGGAEGESIDIHLTGDAVDRVVPGDRVDINGVLKVNEYEDTLYPELWLDGISVDKHESDYEDIDESEHKEQIEEIASGEHGDPYQVLMDSIAPGVIDPEAEDSEDLTKINSIKLAVALQLFSGWRREISPGNHARGDSHILLVGDPGTTKSRMLDSAEKLSPRSSYASGKNATKAGITAAAVRDDFGETEWSLDAGAFVTAHNGLCCIDEIDKVGGDVASSLHTALEKQRLEVAKAGIDATLKCETALLAAGNPENDRFIDDVPEVEQIDVDPALYSRFDLVFILKDKQDEEHDAKIAEHMISARNEAGKKALGEKANTDSIDPAIDPEVLRAYVAYARERVHPVIRDPEVKERLKDKHVKFRKDSNENSPITHRKLDALQRLCEASARVRLSDEITHQDVDLIDSIVGISLADVGLKDGEVGGYKPGKDPDELSQREKSNLVRDTMEGKDHMTPEDVAEETGLRKSWTKKHLENLSNKREPPVLRDRAKGTFKWIA